MAGAFYAVTMLTQRRQVESVERIVVTEPNAPEVIIWARGEDRSWGEVVRQGLDQTIEMPEIGVLLPLKA